ncbi:hypothetical protein BSIN_3432 [Burkholderia singularis]|uniref:Uncharacterized protein n=2 Tax=Burkholderia singularis TaxID=1503053 RepID=A0A238H515_9BURK|nr:hypothetical protein BSIN_3432 [Burkholderia singularis]
MRPADFRLVAKDDARVDEITMAALNASRVGEVTHVLHAVVSKVVLTTGMREVVDAVLAKAGWRTRGQS